MKVFSPPILPIGLLKKLLVELGFIVPGTIPASWAQATWFVDPANTTGVASDSNSGIDAAHPVLSYNGGIVKKWGTTSPTLRQDTTITWLSSQPLGTADPVIFTPIMVASVAILEGQLGPAQLVHSGILGGVVAKNRATAQLLEANLGFAATRDMIVKNTTPGKTSLAWVYLTGAVQTLTQPLTPAPMPFDFSSVVTEVDTWANGDSFEVYEPIRIDLVSCNPTVVELPASFADPVQIYHLVGFSPDGTPGDSDFRMGLNVSIIESAFDSVVQYPTPCDDEGAFVVNAFFGASVQCNTIGYAVVMMGGAIVASPFASIFLSWSPQFDAIVDNLALSAAIIGLNNATVLLVENLYIAGLIHAGGGQFFRGIVWGPGQLDGLGSARLGYTAPAVTRFQNTGGLTLNGQTQAHTISAAGVWSALINITAANLDDAAQLNGIAVNVGGASFSGQGTP